MIEGVATPVHDVTEIRGGLSLMAGKTGCGKTMLAHVFVSWLDDARLDPSSPWEEIGLLTTS